MFYRDWQVIGLCGTTFCNIDFPDLIAKGNDPIIFFLEPNLKD